MNSAQISLVIFSIFLCRSLLSAATLKQKDGAETEKDTAFQEVQWVLIRGGKFIMGIDKPLGISVQPAHEVSINYNFDISKTLVTVEQYQECVIKGQCTEPGKGEYCNWGKPGRQRHPANCLNWHEANQYAKFKGGRLPSEAEWEYAATSAGKKRRYPWGNAPPTCDRAVLCTDDSEQLCGNESTLPVCSKPAGNTAQGLCDMAGNVWQWLQDTWHPNYIGAPTDGSAWEDTNYPLRVLRGGSWNFFSFALLTTFRGRAASSYRFEDYGFRIVRPHQN